MRGLVRCRRSGPYIAEVTITVDASTVRELRRLMRWAQGLARLDTLVIVQPYLSAIYIRPVAPGTGWDWLSIISGALGQVKARLTHLRRVCLGVYMGSREFWVLQVDSQNPTANEIQIHVTIPPVPLRLVMEFILSLPRSATILSLGPKQQLQISDSICGLSSVGYVGMLQLLETNVLPNLQELTALVDVDQPILDALVSMLRRAPFARRCLEILHVQDHEYTGPSDLGPLVYALAGCPKLQSFSIGHGRCDARFLLTLMDLIVDGHCSVQAPSVLVPSEMLCADMLPVSLSSSEQMAVLVDKLTAALLGGRLSKIKLIELVQENLRGNQRMRRVPDEAVDRLLSATRDVELPDLISLRLDVWPGPALELLPEWVAAHMPMHFVCINWGPVYRESTDEARMRRVLEQVMQSPALVPLDVLEFALELQPPLPARVHKDGKHTPREMCTPPERRAVGPPRAESTADACMAPEGDNSCCLLKALVASFRSACRPPPGTGRELYVQYTRRLIPGDERGSEVYASGRDQRAAEHNLFCTSGLPLYTIVGIRLRQAKQCHKGQAVGGPEVPGTFVNPAHDPQRLQVMQRGKWKAMSVDWRFRLGSHDRFTEMLNMAILTAPK